MLRAILNMSWRQHPTKRQLYGHLLPVMKTIQVRRTRYAGNCWRSKDGLISDILLWTLDMDEQKQDDQLELIYNSSVSMQDVALKTCWMRWTIEKGDGRGSGRSVLVAWHDDDDDIKLSSLDAKYSLSNNVLDKLFLRSFFHYMGLNKFEFLREVLGM